jgi:hypothetical protein
MQLIPLFINNWRPLKDFAFYIVLAISIFNLASFDDKITGVDKHYWIQVVMTVFGW